jgi:hypothetical protein
MITPKLAPAMATLGALALLAALPAAANAQHRHHHDPLPYDISYLHNYGPGPLPGGFAYYDGPSTVTCDRSAASYIGQDHRRHPCF